MLAELRFLPFEQLLLTLGLHERLKEPLHVVSFSNDVHEDVVPFPLALGHIAECVRG